MAEESNRRRAYEAAAQRAIAHLASIDLRDRCAHLGLPAPSSDGSIAIRLLGREYALTSGDFRLVDASGVDAHPFDRVLALHYLCAEGRPQESGEYASFRELPSGTFYWGPFRARSSAIIETVAGNDPELLRLGLAGFEVTPFPAGDVGAAVHAIGVVRIALVYRAGDDEFPPSAEVLFDSVVRRVFGTEDAAVLAERFAVRLVGEMRAHRSM